MCTKDLADGWDPDMTFAGLMLQLKTNIIEGKGKIDMRNRYEYSEMEAIEAFKRVARDHGWTVPSHTLLGNSSNPL